MCTSGLAAPLGVRLPVAFCSAERWQRLLLAGPVSAREVALAVYHHSSRSARAFHLPSLAFPPLPPHLLSNQARESNQEQPIKPEAISVQTFRLAAHQAVSHSGAKAVQGSAPPTALERALQAQLRDRLQR